jgi:hypothetical protein
MDNPQSTIHNQKSDLKTIAVLFVVLRVMILLLYTPQGLLNAYTDTHYYYRTAQLSDQGYYPFVNMWYEYPPIATYISQTVYQLVHNLPADGALDARYQVYSRLLSGLFLIFEAGVLIAIHRLARKMWDAATADRLSWIYSVLSVPLFFWNASQNSVVVFFALWSMVAFLNLQRTRSAVLLGLGIATKFTPLFLLAPAIKFLLPNLRASLKYAAITSAAAIVIFIPFVLLGGWQWIVASFSVLARLASYSTPWALLDGNWQPGDAGPLATRLQLDAINHLPGQPAVLPWLATIILFGIIYWLIFSRQLQTLGPKEFVWFATITLMIFLVWSKGWSPQWAMLVIPFLLLSFPDRRGLNLTLSLTLLVFIEWPLADAFQSHLLLAIAIVSRTLLFVSVALLLARELWTLPVHNIET